MRGFSCDKAMFDRATETRSHARDDGLWACALSSLGLCVRFFFVMFGTEECIDRHEVSSESPM